MLLVRPGVFGLTLALAGCAAPPAPPASLAPRAAEAIDPRVPVVVATTSQPVSGAIANRLAELIGQARRGENAFASAAALAQRLASAAGPPQSESWVVAQEALSAAVAARAPTTRALGDIDGITAAALAKQGGLAPADLAATEAAAAEVGAIDQRQAQVIDALQQRLGG
ncbi:MAG: hypothetical protein ABIW03_01820 [Sphingomicrobium sp.]